MAMFKRLRNYLDKRKVILAVGSFDERGLITAVEENDFYSIQVLLANGVDPNAKTERGVPVIMRAISMGNLRMLEALLAAGAETDLADREGKTPLMRAIEHGNKHVFLFFLNHETDLEARDQKGDTALMKAALEGSTTFSRKLIEAGAEVDAINHEGLTPLMVAVDHLRSGIVKALLQAGADPLIRDKTGQTVLDRNHLSPRMSKMLKEAASRLRRSGRINASSSSFDSSSMLSGGLLGQLPRLSAFLIGVVDGALHSMNAPMTLDDAEAKGREMVQQLDLRATLSELSPYERLNSEHLKEELHWLLNQLVEMKQIGTKMGELALETDLSQINSVTKLKRQVTLSLESFSAFLEAEQGRRQEGWDIRVPVTGNGTGEWELTKWLVPSGLPVEAGEVLCELRYGQTPLYLKVSVPGILHRKQVAGSAVSAETLLGYLQPLDEPDAPQPEHWKALPVVRLAPVPAHAYARRVPRSDADKKAQADLNAALLHMVMTGDEGMVELLLAAGANPACYDEQRQSATDLAAGNDKLQALLRAAQEAPAIERPSPKEED